MKSLVFKKGLTVLKRLKRSRVILFLLICYLLVDLLVSFGRSKYDTPPTSSSDVFQKGCREPPAAIKPEDRENAAVVMLARNSEMYSAMATIESFEKQFNQWWHYPIVFMSGEPNGFSQEFIERLSSTASGETQFVTIPHRVWTQPDWIDLERANKAAFHQQDAGIKYGAMPDYHHMCRFYSGPFYKLPELQKYRWYWRLEPGVEYFCAITYDPFKAMAEANKTYGFTIALWEDPKTAPSLFSQTSAFKDVVGISTTNLWRNMIDPSWAPASLRKVLPSLIQRDKHGDEWNLCHFWGNFEIADMEFFRSSRYQSYFDELDRAGGFYYERWGDAPVRSLGAALFLEPSQLHFFADIGYGHAPFRLCPKNAAGGQLPQSSRLNRPFRESWSQEYGDGVGCRCDCDPLGGTNRPTCRNKLLQQS